METTSSHSTDLSREATDLSQLTGYPPAVIKDILEADRMYTLDKICDDVRDIVDKPIRYEFDLSGYGVVRLIRLTDSETSDSRWVFVPTDEFRDGFFNAFYYGISPIIKRAKTNFNQLIKMRMSNILKSSEESEVIHDG